jgi:SAM-dependent methyltransferase
MGDGVFPMHKSFAEVLEEKFAEESEKLANVHLEAAINEQLYDISFEDDETDNHDNPEVSKCFPLEQEPSTSKTPNIYSPYVPTCAELINALIDFVQLSDDDVFLDLGCGDGRVCLAAFERMLQSALTSSHEQPKYRAIGIDVSSDCIAMAQQIYATTQRSFVVEDGSMGPSNSIAFYQADLTVDTSELLSGTLLAGCA